MDHSTVALIKGGVRPTRQVMLLKVLPVIRIALLIHALMLLMNYVIVRLLVMMVMWSAGLVRRQGTTDHALATHRRVTQVAVWGGLAKALRGVLVAADDVCIGGEVLQGLVLVVLNLIFLLLVAVFAGR